MEAILNNNYLDLKQIAGEFKSLYQTAEPFPNIHFENFFNEEVLEAVLKEFPDLSQGDSIKFHNQKEIKYAAKGEYRFGIETKKFMHLLNSQPFLEFLQELSGIDEVLIGDPYYFGGGLHEIKRGGLLKIHADFNKHNVTHLDRRLNVLIYLNKDWKEDYGGHFELWNKDMTACNKKILPTFNTMAIFSTTSDSYHGHPDPLNCPENISRKSLALYYYSNGRPSIEILKDNQEHNTLFKKRPHLDTIDSLNLKNKNKWKKILKEFIPPILLKLKRKLIS